MILVTGGASFIGANFVLDWLRQSDEPVLNLDKLTYAGNQDNLAALQGDPRHVFVAEARMVANFWLRPGNAHSGNLLQFLASTLTHLGEKIVGLLRADSGFFDEAILTALEAKRIPYIIAARLTQPLQRAIYQATGWWTLKPGLELAELRNYAVGWTTQRRLIVVHQSIKRKTAPGKTLSLFADDPDIQGWRYGAFVTTFDLPMYT